MKQNDFPAKKRTLLFIGAITLFNPCVNIVDVIPDVIGFVLISIALAAYAVADSEFDECRRYAHFMLWLSAVKLILSPIVAVSSVDDDRLLATFCFAVAECIFMSLLSSRLLNEIDYLVGRYASEATRGVCSEATDFCRIFVQLKVWLPLLPELTSLAADESHADDINSLEWSAIAEMKSFVIVIVVLTLLVLGVMYLIKLTRLYKALCADSAYNEALQAKYIENDARDIYRSYRSRLKAGLTVVCIGAICFLDISISSVPIVTPFVGMILMGLFGIIADMKKGFMRTLKSLTIALPLELAAILIRQKLPIDIVDIIQMDIQTMLTGLAAAILSAAAWLIFGYCFASDMSVFTRGLGELRHGFKAPACCFVTLLLIRAVAMILPYLKPWTVTPYFAVCVITVITLINTLTAVYDAATKNKKAE